MPIRRNKEEGGRRGLVGQDSNEIVFRENYEISLFLPIIERKENIYECIFFRCSRFLTREIVRPQDEVIIETFAIHSFGWHKPGTLS